MSTLRIRFHEIEVEYDGQQEFEEAKVLRLLNALRKAHYDEVKRSLLQIHESLLEDLSILEMRSESLERLNGELAGRIEDLQAKLVGFVEGVQTFAASSPEMVAAAKQMMEMNQSFNMQYLALQQKMQDESRRFSLLSNIMKTKHDTAKNSISNVR